MCPALAWKVFLLVSLNIKVASERTKGLDINQHKGLDFIQAIHSLCAAVLLSIYYTI